MAANFTQCRYLRRDGSQCTAEAADTALDAYIVLCSKHIAKTVLMVREAAAKKKGSAR